MVRSLFLVAMLPIALALSMSASPSRTAVSGKFSPFAQRALDVVASHPIVKRNPYCEWFSTAEASVADVRDLVQQFSVFSN
eukprot:4396821-Pleurochrysis_carterae.AAC.1